MKVPKTISLADELTAIQRSVSGAQLLLDEWRAEAGEGDARLQAASGMLSLVESRLLQVRSAVRGLLDPAHLWGNHNSTTATPVDGEDPDVRLHEHGDAKRKLRR